MKQLTDNSKSKNLGRFQPGQSGNPSGRPRADASIKELARAHTQAALEALVEIVQNKRAPASARANAATALLDRGWGKPAQFVESVTVRGTFQDYLQAIVDKEEQEKLLNE